jgi:predicted nucleic acid-binding protein
LSDSVEIQVGPVLLDTNVFTWVYVAPRKSEPSKAWIAKLAGRTVVLSVQTEVEIRGGPRLAKWGTTRTNALLAQLSGKVTIPVDRDVQGKYVDLTVWSKESAHPIHQKIHSADRWIAATALAYDLDLASGDGIFNDVDGLRVLTL